MNNFELHKFSDIAQHITQKVNPAETDLEYYVGLEHLDPESLNIKRWGSPSDVKGEKILVSKGDLIFGKRRAYQRKVAIADFDCICSAHAMVLKPNENTIIRDLFPFFLQSDQFMERAVQISVGGLSPTINWRDLARQEFNLPPIEEQKQIVKILWAAEDVIVKNETFLAEAEHYKQLMMRDLFHKGISGKRYKRKKRNVLFPEKWEFQNLGTICVFYDHLRIPLNETVRKERAGEYPYYGAQGIIDWVNDFIFDGDFLLLAEDGENLNSKILPLVYHVSGKFWVNNHAHIISPKEGFDISFLMHILNYIDIRGRITGSAQPKLTQDDAKKIKLPCPNYSEQRQIAEILDKTDATIAAARETIESTKALKMKLINELLSPEGDDEVS